MKKFVLVMLRPGMMWLGVVAGISAFYTAGRSYLKAKNGQPAKGVKE